MKRSAFSRYSPSARLEVLEARIAPATLFVDNSADFIITSDTGAPGLSPGDEVTWVQGSLSAHEGRVTQLIFGTNAFSSINSAIAAAEVNDVIRVGPGFFFETVVVDKTVTLLGNQNGVDAAVRGLLPETKLRSNDGTPITLAANHAVLDGFDLRGLSSDSTGVVPTAGVKTSPAASGYRIENNVIDGGHDFSSLSAEAVNLASNGEFLTVVAQNKITGGSTSVSKSPGIVVTGTFADAHIVANRIDTNGGVGIFFEPATGAGSDPVVIGRNTFAGVSDAKGRAIGVVVGISTSGETRLSIAENVFSGQNMGVLVQSIPVSTEVVIRLNSFAPGSSYAGTPATAITSAAPQVIDARYNWYGTTAPAAVDALVSGNVDFDPFLLSGDDSRTDIAGFQSVPTLRILSERVATLLDVDGDLIMVSVSKGTLHPSLFTVAVQGSGDGVQLQELFLGLPMFQGANVSITGKRSAAGGDHAVNVGTLYAEGVDLGKVVIGGDLGAVHAGNAAAPADAIKSLQTHSIGRFADVSLAEGATRTSFIMGSVGSLAVRGNIEHAAIYLFGAGSKDLRAVKIGGSLLGGSLFSDGNIGNVAIRGSIIGGTESATGGIFAEGKLGNVTVGGSLISAPGGSNAQDTAFIRSTGDMGFVKIGGDVIGGETGGARIFTDDFTPAHASRIAGVKIGGSLVGGTGDFSGAIVADGALGPVRIGGDVRGVESAGVHGATIVAGNGAAGITIGGSLIGVGRASGNIFIEGGTGPIAIKGSIIGGSEFSGTISVAPHALTAAREGLQSLTVGGSIVGGQGQANVTGSIFVEGPLGAVKIGGSLIGGYAAVAAEGVTFSGSIRADRIASVAIKGSFIAPPLLEGTVSLESASIAAEISIGPVTIGGDMIGSAESRPQIMAGGLTAGLTLASVKIRGDIIFGRILAGYAPDATPLSHNGHAQIGAVFVGGDWIASDLAAGVESADGFFGNGNDTAIPMSSAGVFSRIASLTVKGNAAGTIADPFDHFGIVAQEIGRVTIHGVKFPLTPGAGNDLSATNPLTLIGSTNDFRVREIAV